MNEATGIEAAKLPLRQAELSDLDKTYVYELKPPMSRTEFEQHPKYAKLVQLSMNLFGGRAGFVLRRATTTEDKDEDFIGFSAPKGTTREAVGTMFDALRIVGIADVRINAESYPSFPRKPLVAEEIAALRIFAAPKREGSVIVPTCEINPDLSLKRIGYKLVDVAGKEYAFRGVPAGEFSREKALGYAGSKVEYLRGVLQAMEDRVMHDEFEVETMSFVPREVRFYKDMLAECLSDK